MKDLYKKVNNYPKIEKIHMSVDRKIDKQLCYTHKMNMQQ